MATTNTDLTYPFVYPWFAINLFLTLYVASHVIKIALYYVSRTFRDINEEKQRNVITYVIEIFVTIFALVAQLYGGKELLFQTDAFPDLQSLEWATMSLQSISVLYVWEIIFRLTLRWPLLLHHIVTLLMIQLVSLAFSETHDIVFLRFAVAMGLHATTEQMSFVALLAYRLEIYQQYQSLLFVLATYQTFMAKTAVFVGTTTYYFAIFHDLFKGPYGTSHGWYGFWKYCYLPLHLLLFFAQIYACKILFLLSQTAKRRLIDKKMEMVDEMEKSFSITTSEVTLVEDEMVMKGTAC